MATFDEKRRARLEIMHRLYQLSDGFPWAMVSFEELTKGFGFSEVEKAEVILYLRNEGLLEWKGDVLSITHAGVKEVETALSQRRASH